MEMTYQEQRLLQEIKDTLALVTRKWVPEDHLTPGHDVVMSLVQKGLITYQNGLIFLTDPPVSPSDPLHPPEHLDT